MSPLPTGWKETRIRNVSKLSPGFSVKGPNADETCAVLPMEGVSEVGNISITEFHITEDIPNGLTNFERGDVLFAKITPCMENGKGAYVSALPTRYGFGSTEFHILRPLSQIDGKYLYYLTYDPVYREFAAKNMTGAAGQKRVGSRFLKDTRIPLPPLPEQRRIAAFLDKSCAAIDRAIAAKERQIELLGRRLDSTVEALILGESVQGSRKRVNKDWIQSVPTHWKLVAVKRVLCHMDYGISESTQDEGRYPVLKMGNIIEGELKMENLDYVESVDETLLLEAGDILYNRTNSADQVGKAAIVRFSKSAGITFASYLVRMRTNHRIRPEYLNIVVNSQSFLGFARKMAIPSVQQSNLNSTRYGRMMIPLPPIAEQDIIISRLVQEKEVIGKLKNTITAQINALREYRKSLIHECVTGQRRV